ncbi:MAG: aminoacyl-tRNA hydrolase [Clostridia bacterium]|nr:aminoacyl-tRNA hydrolase [Clostridia bacterium]
MSIFDLFDKIRQTAPAGPVSYLVVGLGNPGTKYEKTRHNAGFMAIDAIARQLGISSFSLKFDALCAEATINGTRVLLMKPQTMMNLSGQAVRKAADFYKISAQNVLVFCDDVSFAEGKLRIRRKGSAGGQNGMKNIIAHLGTDDFPRVKIGVGQKPHPDYDLADFVLSVPASADLEKIKKACENAYDIASLIVKGEIDQAMQKFST